MKNTISRKETKKFFITGYPGIGKTTFIMSLADSLKDLSIAGFYTQEIRTAGIREGFKISTFDGKNKIFAHEKSQSRIRISKYGVNIEALDEIINFLIKREKLPDLWLIDEIGKMESYSSLFRHFIDEILYKQIPVVATISVSGGSWIASARNRKDIMILELNKTNRTFLVNTLSDKLKNLIQRG
jgi:nucleoside-triphosphatase